MQSGPALDGTAQPRHHPPMTSRCLAAAGLALVLVTASPAAAQLGPPVGFPGARGGGWSPVAVVRAGWSLRDSSPSLGGSLRLPIPLPLRPAIAGGGDFVFQDGLTERQAMVDVTLGLTGGIYAGGGPAWLNSVFENETTRATRLGYTLVAGVGGRAGPVSTELQFRWLRVDGLGPNFLTLGVTYPVRALFGG